MVREVVKKVFTIMAPDFYKPLVDQNRLYTVPSFCITHT